MIARWTSVDPLVEKNRRWSAYDYGDDDPIRMTDPDGMEGHDEVKKPKPAPKPEPSILEKINTTLKKWAGAISIANVGIAKSALPSLPKWFVGAYGKGFVTPGASSSTTVLSIQSRRLTTLINEKIGINLSTKVAGDVAEVVGKGAVVTTIATTVVENGIYSKSVIDGKQNVQQVEDHYNDPTTSPAFWLYKHTFEPLLKLIPAPTNGVSVDANGNPEHK